MLEANVVAHAAALLDLNRAVEAVDLLGEAGACSDRLYAYPTLRAVVPIAEMGEFVAKVHARVGHPLVPA